MSFKFILKKLTIASTLLYHVPRVEPGGISVYCTVNLCLATIKYKNPSWTSITVPQKYVFDFKE